MTNSTHRRSLTWAGLALAGSALLCSCGGGEAAPSASVSLPAGTSIVLTTPGDGAAVSSTVSLSGIAASPSGQIYWTLLDAEGNTPQAGVLDTTASTGAAQPFDEQIDLAEGLTDPLEPGTYTLQVATAQPGENSSEPATGQMDSASITLD